jgi:hypothetical protein
MTGARQGRRDCPTNAVPRMDVDVALSQVRGFLPTFGGHNAVLVFRKYAAA